MSEPTLTKADAPFKKWQKPMLIAAIVWGAIAVAFAWQKQGAEGAIAALSTFAFLLAGLKITEYLVAVLTGVAKANKMAVGLLFFAKLLWWALIYFAMQHFAARAALPIIFGLLAFLLSILSAGLAVAGPPKISFENERDS